MIREDYILSWIKRYVQWLMQIAGFIKTADYASALERINFALQALLNLRADAINSLSDGEIVARLVLGEPTQLVQDKCIVLATLLKQLGQVCAAQGQLEPSRDCYLKALHILLGLDLREPAPPLPPFAPSVEELSELLGPSSLPPRTYGALVLFHEKHGRYAKAEDALFALLEAAPDSRLAIDVGLNFYQRLLALSDEALEVGNLPRTEVEAGLAELRARAGA